MATEPAPTWIPEWAVPPGDILLEVLEERGLSQSELARRLDRPIKTVNEIVKGKAAITPDTAIQLERALGITARFWNNLEVNYRESLARERAHQELKKQATWAKRFPVKELLRYGVLQQKGTPTENVDALLRFFGVSNRTAWETRWAHPDASFRKSASFKSGSEALATWLRWGEVVASTVETRPYGASDLANTIGEIRKLTVVVPTDAAIARLQKLGVDCGVIFVLVPDLLGAPISGAARWLASDRALVQLSLRHKRDDQFWFSVFHELDHLLHPKTRTDFLDPDAPDDGSREEVHANQFARDVLIPPADYARFIEAADLSVAAVKQFARNIGIAPGIVVGRLQHDELLAPSKLSGLKRPMGWLQPPKGSSLSKPRPG